MRLATFVSLSCREVFPSIEIYHVLFISDNTLRSWLMSKKKTSHLVQYTHKHCTLQRSTVSSQARKAHAWLRNCIVLLVRLKRICRLVRTSLTLCCSFTCRAPRAHLLPHSLFLLPRHQKTHHNRDNTIYSKNIQFIWISPKTPGRKASLSRTTLAWKLAERRKLAQGRSPHKLHFRLITCRRGFRKVDTRFLRGSALTGTCHQWLWPARRRCGRVVSVCSSCPWSLRMTFLSAKRCFLALVLSQAKKVGLGVCWRCANDENVSLWTVSCTPTDCAWRSSLLVNTTTKPTHTSHSRTRFFSAWLNTWVIESTRIHASRKTVVLTSSNSKSHAASLLFSSHLSTTSRALQSDFLSDRQGPSNVSFGPLAETHSPTSYEPKDLNEEDTSILVKSMFFHRPSMTSTYDSAESIATSSWIGFEWWANTECVGCTAVLTREREVSVDRSRVYHSLRENSVISSSHFRQSARKPAAVLSHKKKVEWRNTFRQRRHFFITSTSSRERRNFVQVLWYRIRCEISSWRTKRSSLRKSKIWNLEARMWSWSC